MDDPTDPAGVVRKAYGHLFGGDLEAFLDCLAEDCVLHEAASLPYGGLHHGRDGIRRVVMQMMELWQTFRFDIEEILSSRDTVIAYGRMTVSGKGTGVTASFPLAKHWKVEGGKAVAITAVYGDTHLARQAAGT